MLGASLIVLVVVVFFALIIFWQRQTGQVRPVYVRAKRARNTGGNYPVMSKHYISSEEYEEIYAK